MTNFVPLHLHTDKSLLDGVGKPERYADRMLELGMKSAAITDHGVLYGVYDWWKIMTAHGIKPIIGMEAYMAHGSMSDRSKQSYHLILLAQNETGYKNLLKISSRAFIDGMYYHPRCDLNLLSAHSEGIICTSACIGGPVANNILNGDDATAEKFASDLAAIFPGRFYIEIQYHGLPDQEATAEGLISTAKKLNLPLVATNDTHYVHRKDAKAQGLLLCIQTKSTIANPRMKPLGNQFYLKSHEEMTSIFGDYPESISNTALIADQCNVDLSFKGYNIPYFSVPEGQTINSYLEHLVYVGAREKYTIITEEIERRIQYELSVIRDMDFGNYFLVVWDIVRFAKKNGILVGAGRGSAAGSIVSYCLDITTVCPLKYELIFERFLMPGRVGMPDIDLDFDSTRRSEIINYVTNKYGDDRVAQMATFGTMIHRSAVRDTGRAMGLSYADVERLSNLIPNTFNMTLSTAVNLVPEIKALYESSPMYKELIDNALSVEGVSRHASKHAAGIVISSDPLVEHVPLQVMGSKKKKDIVTQFDMGAIEANGLLKMDFLGLSTLSVMNLASEFIREKKPDFNIDNIPEDDPATFALLQRGETSGLFQLEGNMNSLLIRDVHPEKIEDIMVQIALSRPGPRDLAFEYIARKHGLSEVTYMHPKMEEILRETYGVLVFQEDVIKIANALAGFSLTEGEGLRKVISKKKPDEMARYKERFIAGCISNGIDSDLASDIFDTVDRFALYGLNRAHSAAYAVIGYQTAYLKANYPHEFIAAWLTNDTGNSHEITRIVSEAKRMGISVLPPDINSSTGKFNVEGESVRFSLGAVRNVGERAVQEIISARGKTKTNAFESIEEFANTIDWSIVNRRSFENLIRAGAFDSFGFKRAYLLEEIDMIMSAGKENQRNVRVGQMVLIESEGRKQREIPLRNMGHRYHLPKSAILAWERETLGVYLGDHPLDGVDLPYHAYINEMPDYLHKERINIVCIASVVRKITTKAGRAMAGLQVEDLTGRTEVVVFPDQYEKYGDIISVGEILDISGTVDRRESNIKIIADKVEKFVPKSNVSITLIIPDDMSDSEMKRVRRALDMNPGDCDVYVNMGGRIIKTKIGVFITDLLILRLTNMLGDDGVVIRS